VSSGALDEDVVVIEASPAPAPAVPASEEINVTSTDSEVEIVTVGDGFRLAFQSFQRAIWKERGKKTQNHTVLLQ